MKIVNILMIIFLITINIAIAGELEPLALPQSSMKPLNLVEPRTALIPNGETISIDVPGSYYLTGNLTVQNNIDGITINADRVTLDLNGFTVEGSNLGTGIDVSQRKSIVIKNGKIKGFEQGIDLTSSSIVRIDHMQVGGVQGNAVSNASHNTIIANVNVSNNAVEGVLLSAEANYVIIRDSRVVNNGSEGVDFDFFGFTNSGMLIKNCIVLNNTKDIQIQNGLVVESIYKTIDEEGITDIVDSKQVN